MTPNKSNKMLFIVIGIIAIIVVAGAAYAILGNSNQTPNATPTPTPAPTPLPTVVPLSDPEYVGGTQVLLHTSAGDIIVALRNDKPITTTNFINLVNRGIYSSTIFHRVIAGFMIQGGQNTSANVATIQDEIGNDNHNVPYTIAMAKTSQPNSATSEFFINVGNNSPTVYPDGSTFDGTYTVFGKVVAGQSVVDSIANAQVTTNAYGENSEPVHPVTLLNAFVLS